MDRFEAPLVLSFNSCYFRISKYAYLSWTVLQEDKES